MPVVVLSYTCIRYIPQFRRPVTGSLENTMGSVINRPSSAGCPSPGQHLIIGNMLRSGWSFSTTSWHGALLTVLGRYFENSRSLGSIANFSNRVLGGD